MFMDKKRRGMFGGVVVPGTPGIGDGIEERQQMEMGDPAPGLGMRGAPLPQQPGFERPTGWRRAAGIFADFAAGVRGKEGQYAAMLEKRRETAAELANEQRKRSLGLEDYEAKKQIDQRYQAPGDTIDLREDNAGNVWQFDKRTGRPISDKPVWIDKTPKEFVHEGMRFSIRNPFGDGGGPDLDGTPVSEDGHTYTPGPGGRANPANWKPEGGAGSNASGGFREAFDGF